jgi:glycosyltransferase involved in cell wall biosynthesis
VWVTGTDYHELKDRWFDRDLFHSALRLADAAEHNGIDHIHSPWADTCAFIALVAARLLNVPYSVQARAHDIHRVDYGYALREKLGQAAFVVTNTRYNFEHIAGIVGQAEAGRIHVIHNGLNLAQFRPPRRAGHQGPVRLLCVARLIDQKGIEELLRACRKLSDAGVDLRCDIVGGFEDIFMRYYVGLKRLHRDLELQSLVHFAGSRPFENVLDFYRRADLFVLPCVIAPDGSRDIIPNSVLEAMAMALPVVSTTVTGLPEMVDDGRTGFLVPPHDVDALATAIGKLARSHRMREDFGRAGRAKVEASFDIDANAAKYRALFASDPNACREAAARG